MPKHPFGLAPVREIEAFYIEAGILNAVGPLSYPGIQSETELLRRKDILEPGSTILHSSANSGSQSVHFASMKAVDIGANSLIVPP